MDRATRPEAEVDNEGKDDVVTNLFNTTEKCWKLPFVYRRIGPLVSLPTRAYPPCAVSRFSLLLSTISGSKVMSIHVGLM